MTLLLEEVYKLQVLDLDILSSSKLLSDIKYKISDKKELDSLEEKLNINSSNLKKLQVMKNNVELDVASIQESVNLISKKIYHLVNLSESNSALDYYYWNNKLLYLTTNKKYSVDFENTSKKKICNRILHIA